MTLENNADGSSNSTPKEQKPPTWARYERERRARQMAERLLEIKSLELYKSNQDLLELSRDLEQRVIERTEQLRRQTEELITLSNTKERFMANITHELRTPLQGILGFANLGASRAATLSTDKCIKYFQTISSSGETLLSLVNNLLDLAKLNAGMLEIDYTRFDLEVAFTEVVNELSLLAGKKNITLEKTTDNMGNITADRFRVQQVLRNIYSNAIKFSPPESTIIIETTTTPDYWEMRITNSGNPIPSDEAELIFNPFTESRTTSHSGGGTGLGLAICQQIISAHDGALWVEPGADTNCFIIRIPTNLSKHVQKDVAA